MIVEEFPDFRFEFVNIDDLLISNLNRPFQLRELLPITLELIDLLLIKNVENITGRAACSPTSSRVMMPRP